MVLAAANLFGIMSTLSRSGFISLVVVMTFLLVKLTRNLRAVGVVLLLIIAGAIMMPEELFARFSRIDQVKDVDRLQIVQVGAAMALDHPFLGVGLGNYVPEFWNYNVSNMKREAPAHNMYLDLSAQMGFPSLILYLWIFGITWAGLRRMELHLKERGRTRTFPYLFNLGLQAFFLNLAVFGLSGDVEFDYGAFIMLGAALTLLAVHDRESGAGGKQVGRAGASGRN